MSEPVQTVEDRLRKYCGGVGLEAVIELSALRDRVAALEGAIRAFLIAHDDSCRAPEDCELEGIELDAIGDLRSILSRAQQGGGEK